MNPGTKGWFTILAAAFFFAARAHPADSIRIATFNVENYLIDAVHHRPVKSAESKARVCESILALRPDLIALQEIGGTNALLQLRADLHRAGLEYPHWGHVTGSDTNIQVALLSRFPLLHRVDHTNDWFLLGGRRFRVSRGFSQVEVQVSDRYKFTVLAAHLKSRRPVPEADETEMREKEAAILREKINILLARDPNLNLVVLGDFNDTHDSKAIRTLIGRGKTKLLDTRPGEKFTEKADGARTVAWTHFYGKEDTYSRIDYILVSSGMAREWIPADSRVLALPNWGQASDHRPVMASFTAEDR